MKPLRIEVHPTVDLQIEGYVKDTECAARVEAAVAACDPSGRLAAQLEYSERMRRSYIEAAEELKAVKLERDGLRARVRQLEANIAAMQSSQRSGDDYSRALDRMMRERPHHRR